MQIPAHFPSRLIFNGLHVGGPAHTPIELSAVGGFGALLVVFNQPPADHLARVVSLSFPRPNALNHAPSARGRGRAVSYCRISCAILLLSPSNVSPILGF